MDPIKLDFRPLITILEGYRYYFALRSMRNIKVNMRLRYVTAVKLKAMRYSGKDKNNISRRAVIRNVIIKEGKFTAFKINDFIVVDNAA